MPSALQPEPQSLPPTPDLAVIEAELRHLWEAEGIHNFDPSGTGPVFSVDTPPPYVSAAHLHVGHAMSYAQAEFLVRYRRMRGDRIFYPMGFDDNGLPTERYVERKYRTDKRAMTRSEFRTLCLEETAAAATVYEELWRALGLSVDWSLRYSTIDDRSRRTAQLSFVEAYRAGRIYRSDDPVFWDPVFGSALSQADLELVERTTMLVDIAFTAPDGTRLVISTTRPELLPACVALYCHPDDARHAGRAGTRASVPLFGGDIPVLTDADVDPGYGTGLMMVCTFGDADDVRRWRRDRLNTRICLDDAGRMTDGAGPYAGLTVDDARKATIRDLDAAGAIVDRRVVKQRVAVSERTGAPVEFLMRPQWFLRMLDMKDEILAASHALEWHPPWMRQRLDDWVEGLAYDWNLSRQRYYGVPFPVWFCACGHPIVASPEQLPVDPLEDRPPLDACPQCGAASLAGDPDVMDTWMTSSLTPQMLMRWADAGGDGRVPEWPLTLRVQAHDIIRNWLFYSVVKGILHQGSLPWTHVAVSGWGLNEQGKRISKRDFDPHATPGSFSRYEPCDVIERYGADALRHWAARAALGQDTRYHERDVKAGRKVVLKLWNAARFCEPHLVATATTTAVRSVEDRWLASRTARAVAHATAALDEFDYATARQAADDLLWSFTDDWLEITKDRIWHPDRHDAVALESAAVTMSSALRTIIALYAPFLPYVTDALYQALFRGNEGPVSIHVTSWPRPARPAAGDASDFGQMDTVLAVLHATRAIRTDRRVSQTTEAAVLVVDSPDDLSTVATTLRAAARSRLVEWGPATTATDLGTVRVDLRF